MTKLSPHGKFNGQDLSLTFLVREPKEHTEENLAPNMYFLEE